jgi:hypothetical protein
MTNRDNDRQLMTNKDVGFVWQFASFSQTDRDNEQH